MKKWLSLLALVLLYSTAHADDDAAAILTASAGTWNGTLYYLDYQSGQRFGIPIQIDAEVTPDRATLIRKLTFTDPGAQVHAVSLSTVDRDSGELVEAFFREGKGEWLRSTITEAMFESSENWRIVYEQEGRDNDQPATIRHTIERDGNSMTTQKEVRFMEEGSAFLLRNSTEVTLEQ
jgi:hypothetical protein